MKYPYTRLFIGCCIFIVLLYLRVHIIFSNGTDIAGTEQNVVYSIQVLMDKGLLYFSPLKAPFSVTQYTPLYYYLCAFTAKISGHSAADIQNLYIIGRSWDLLFNLVTALLLYKIARDIFKLSKGLAGFLFLASFALSFPHNFAVRSDSLQDMFAIGAIYCFLHYQVKSKFGKKTIMVLACAVLLSALSVFSKQSGIQYILIFGAYCLLARDWGTLFKVVALSIIIYGGLLVFFITKNEYFLQNVVGGVANGINLHDFVVYIIGRKIFVMAVWPLIFIAGYLLWKNKPVFKGGNADSLLTAFMLGTLAFSMLTALKMGSTVQYFVVFINLSVLYIVKAAKNETVQGVAPWCFQIFQAYITLLMLVFIAYDYKLIQTFDKNPGLEAQRTSAVKTADYITQQMVNYKGKYVFANLTNDYAMPSRQSINNILYRECLVPDMDIQEYSTGPLKVFGYDNLDETIKAGQVEFIIESAPLIKFTILNDLAGLIKTKYTLIKNIDGYLIYQLNTQGVK